MDGFKKSDMNSENSNPSSAANLSLEEIVHIANKVGLQYVDAKKKSEYFAMLKPTIKSKIMLKFDDGNMTEAKLQRLTETNEEYLDFLVTLSDAKRESDRLKIRYESYKNLFEARRSLLSFKKAEMKLL